MGYSYRDAGLAVLKASPAGQAYSAAKGLVSAPGKILKGIFGGGPPAWKRSEAFRDYERARDAAQAGDDRALERLAELAGLRPPKPGTRHSTVRQRANNAYQNIESRRFAEFNQGRQSWGDGSGGSARRVALVRRQPVSRRSGSSAPPAKRPCKYGPRVEGLCPKKPRSTRGLSGGNGTRRKPPCKYGPRDEDGYCPKKNSLGSTATRRRVEGQITRAVERTVVTAARKVKPETYRKLGATAAKVGTFAAKASLVGLAGVAAYWITTQLMKVRFKTYQDMRDETADAYRRSRQAIAAAEGRGLTPAEGAQLSAWFKERTARINAAERAGTPIRSLYNLTFKD